MFYSASNSTPTVASSHFSDPVAAHCLLNKNPRRRHLHSRAAGHACISQCLQAPFWSTLVLLIAFPRAASSVKAWGARRCCRARIEQRSPACKQRGLHCSSAAGAKHSESVPASCTRTQCNLARALGCGLGTDRPWSTSSPRRMWVQVGASCSPLLLAVIRHSKARVPCPIHPTKIWPPNQHHRASPGCLQRCGAAEAGLSTSLQVRGHGWAQGQGEAAQQTCPTLPHVLTSTLSLPGNSTASLAPCGRRSAPPASRLGCPGGRGPATLRQHPPERLPPPTANDNLAPPPWPLPLHGCWRRLPWHRRGSSGGCRTQLLPPVFSLRSRRSCPTTQRFTFQTTWPPRPCREQPAGLARRPAAAPRQPSVRRQRPPGGGLLLRQRPAGACLDARRRPCRRLCAARRGASRTTAASACLHAGGRGRRRPQQP